MYNVATCSHIGSIFMKKILLTVLLVSFVLPVFAIADVNLRMQQEQQKYQMAIDRVKRKQELKCLKHPEKCITTPVEQTNLTLGTAQKNIKIGTSQDEVATMLGSPNIVTVDSEGHDTWIYDKVASVTSYGNTGFNVGIGGFGGGVGSDGGGGGLIGAGYGRNGGVAQSNQKTLTIVIKFTDKKVSSFNYHMSNF